MADELSSELISKAAAMAARHLHDYERQMNRAYDNADKELTVTLAVKFARHKDGIRIATGISFVTEKIKDGISVVIDPKQLPLFRSHTDVSVIK